MLNMLLHSVVRGSARIANAAGACLLGIVVLAGCGGGGSAATPAAPANAPVTTTPAPATTATPAPTAGGVVDIAVPASAPVICSPAPVTVPVGSTIVIDCTSQGYGGPLTWMVSDPTVAAVQLASESYTFFYVTGLQTGTATLSFQSPAGGTGDAITVTPATP